MNEPSADELTYDWSLLTEELLKMGISVSLLKKGIDTIAEGLK